MKYTITFDENELRILDSLVGQSLVAVQSPGIPYSIRLLCGEKVIDFEPEEFSTPEEGNDFAWVTRPTINVSGASDQLFKTPEILANDLGAIQSVQILRTVVIYSDLQPIGPTVILNVELPTTHGWGHYLLAPDDSRLKRLENYPGKAQINLDVGVAIKTSNEQIYIYTDGNGYAVSAYIGSVLPEILEGRIKYQSLE